MFFYFFITNFFSTKFLFFVFFQLLDIAFVCFLNNFMQHFLVDINNVLGLCNYDAAASFTLGSFDDNQVVDVELLFIVDKIVNFSDFFEPNTNNLGHFFTTSTS